MYQAMDENLNCVVAVKETFAKTEEHRRAFRREAELLANLNHPTLPKVMDHFTQGEEQFLVMQFVSGHDLAELLGLREQPFAVEKVLGWAEQLLDALEELHSYEPPIIHRDLKPSNLKVTSKGRVVLLDFGLAKGAAGQMSTADADSQPKSIYGYTPNYAPLEQIRGAGTDARSDLYSLGATMWSLLTGKVPPDALSRVAEKEEGNADPLIHAHELNADVPVSVSEAISRAMNLNRNQRPASAAEMRRELHAGKHRDATSQPLQSPIPGASTAETVKMAEAPQVSTLPNQPTPTLPAPKPPPVPSRAPVVGPTVASLSPWESSTQTKRNALIGAGAAAAVAGVVVVVVVTITLAIWRPWSRNSMPKNITAQLGIEMVWISPGSFMMGSEIEANRRPSHRVTIGKGFYMGKYEVTQAQWQSVMGKNPSYFRNCGGGCPVESVSWFEAQDFVRRLNLRNDGYTYRLPTEAEWEYACRAGTTDEYSGGNFVSMAWYDGNSALMTHPVGRQQPNAFGLYDMMGNVWEICQDAYHETYNGAPNDGSAWQYADEKLRAVARGGGFTSGSSNLGSSVRAYPSVANIEKYYGLRLVAVR